MKNGRRGMWDVVALGRCAMAWPGSSHAALSHYSDTVFKDTTQAKRMYVALLQVQQNQLLELWTDTAANAATDPVLFVLSENKDSQGNPIIKLGSDDISTTDVDARITLTPTQTQLVKVVLVAYDTAYSGWTTLRGRSGGTTLPGLPLNLWVGGTAIQMKWSSGDTLTATADYASYTPKVACETLVPLSSNVTSATWLDNADLSLRRCLVVIPNGTPFEYNAYDTCVLAGPASGKPLAHNFINWRSDLCEYASEVSDTVAIAVDKWSKLDAVCSGGTCTFPNLDPMFKNYDDDSGSGRQFQLKFSSSGTQTNGSAVLFGLIPWMTEWTGYYENPAAPAPDEVVYASLADDWCSLAWKNPAYVSTTCETDLQTQFLDYNLSPFTRLYKESSTATDSDGEGLSDSLETKLGTSTTKPDTDLDGIMDRLEVYGPIAPARTPGELEPEQGQPGWGRSVRALFPLPLYGASPTRKDVVIEVDVQQGHISDGTDPQKEARAIGRGRSMATAYKALADAGIHTIMIERGPNRDNVLADDTDFWEPGWPDVRVLKNGIKPEWLGVGGLIQSFDLQEYPFVRRMAWVNTVMCPDPGYAGCGQTVKGWENMSAANVPGRAAGATLQRHHRLPYGRYFLVKATDWTVSGGAPTGPTWPIVFAHELAHTLGFGHGGPGWVYEYQHAPNRYTLSGYGVELPVSHALFTTSGGAVEQDIRPRDASGNPINQRHPWRHRDTGTRDRPPSFLDTAFRTIDEASLNEGNGLVTSANGYTYRNIRNPRTLAYEDEIRVTWVDWNLDGSKQAGPYSRYDTIPEGTTDSRIANPDPEEWVPDIGYNCWENTLNGRRLNYTTGSHGNSRATGCRDITNGQYTVADTTNWFPSAAPTPGNSTSVGIALEALPNITYTTELAYLQNLNMQLWASGFDGFWQLAISQSPDWSLTIPYSTSTLTGVSLLPTSYEE